MAVEFTEAFFILFLVFMVIIFAVIMLLRMAKYGTILGSIGATLMGGIPIVDKGGSGDICELIGYDQHPITKKIRLRLNFIDKFSEGQTGYWFDEEDFFPALHEVAGSWDNYHGTITLYKDFENRQDYRNATIHKMTETIKTLRGMVNNYRMAGKEVIEYLERSKIQESRKAEAFEGAKMLKAMKSLVEEVNVDTITPTSKDEGMFDE